MPSQLPMSEADISRRLPSQSPPAQPLPRLRLVSHHPVPPRGDVTPPLSITRPSTGARSTRPVRRLRCLRHTLAFLAGLLPPSPAESPAQFWRASRMPVYGCMCPPSLIRSQPVSTDQVQLLLRLADSP